MANPRNNHRLWKIDVNDKGSHFFFMFFGFKSNKIGGRFFLRNMSMVRGTQGWQGSSAVAPRFPAVRIEKNRLQQTQIAYKLAQEATSLANDLALNPKP